MPPAADTVEIATAGPPTIVPDVAACTTTAEPESGELIDELQLEITEDDDGDDEESGCDDVTGSSRTSDAGELEDGFSARPLMAIANAGAAISRKTRELWRRVATQDK